MRIVAAGLALAVVGLYAAACAWVPLARCRSCRGALIRPRRGPLAGMRTAVRGVRWCRRCAGTGRRIRIGRRAYNHLRALQRAGTR
jgi:hypothetical protein